VFGVERRRGIDSADEQRREESRREHAKPHRDWVVGFASWFARELSSNLKFAASFVMTTQGKPESVSAFFIDTVCLPPLAGNRLLISVFRTHMVFANAPQHLLGQLTD
jgi:hypothetical protein